MNAPSRKADEQERQRSALQQHPRSLASHLQELRPPRYDELLPLRAHQPEGAVVCVDLRASGPALVAMVYEGMSELAQICRYCPLVVLAPADIGAVLSTLHSRPFSRGLRGVLVTGMPWRAILEEALTEERTLAQDLAAWILSKRRHHRLDREILEAILSLPRSISLAEGLFRSVASADTVATHLKRLRLPPASQLTTLGLAVRGAMRLQRNPDATIESVAKSLGYTSGAAVSLMITRMFSATTREVREKLGWEWLMGRWESGRGGGVLPGR